MKIKNISERTYQHDIYTIKSGAEISVPDNIAKMLLRTKEFILLDEPKKEIKVEIKEEIKKEEPKKEVKKSVNSRKSNRKRV